jgi:competence protein ComGC
MEYTIKNENGHIKIMVGSFVLCSICYSMDRTKSPISEEKAEEWINIIKCMIESEYPASELDEDDYESTLSKLLKDGDMDKDDLFGLMMMKALMG